MMFFATRTDNVDGQKFDTINWLIEEWFGFEDNTDVFEYALVYGPSVEDAEVIHVYESLDLLIAGIPVLVYSPGYERPEHNNDWPERKVTRLAAEKLGEYLKNNP